MKIISHRGFWNNEIQKNSKESFINSFTQDFGTETDIRDLNGRLVISHDLPIEKDLELDFDAFLKLYKDFSNPDKALPLALNIKADGLQDLLINSLQKFKVENYFLFDMSIPDQLQFIKRNCKVFTRQSEYENIPALYDNAIGVWLDAFEGLWYNGEIINKHLMNEKLICIVSSDLHKRDYLEQWKFIKENLFHCNENIILCTDFPIEAKKYFHENN